jgi:hypothetical protein
VAEQVILTEGLRPCIPGQNSWNSWAIGRELDEIEMATFCPLAANDESAGNEESENKPQIPLCPTIKFSGIAKPQSAHPCDTSLARTGICPCAHASRALETWCFQTTHAN